MHAHTHTHTHTHSNTLSFLQFQLNTNLFDTIVMVMSAKDDVNFWNTSCKFLIIWPSHVGEGYHQVCTLWKRRTACKGTVATCALPGSLIHMSQNSINVTCSHQLSLNLRPAYCATGKSSQRVSVWVFSDFYKIKVYKH